MSADIVPRLGPDARNGATAIWRDGFKAAMTRVETRLLAGDLDALYGDVTTALAEKRGRKRLQDGEQ